MAIEVCSEISSPGFSPRISFSHDLDKSNAAVPKEGQQQQQQRLDSSLVDSSSDFDFCIVNNLKLELSSADELFSNGQILPVQIKQNPNTTRETKPRKETLLQPHYPIAKNIEKKRLKEFLEDSNADDEDDENVEKPPIAKPSWQFRRSSSLNFESTTARGKNLILSLHFLSRSNSTGSAPNSNHKPQHQQQHFQKQQSTNSRRRSSSASSSCSSTTYYSYNSSPSWSQKPSLRRSGSYGNGVRINPVLNLPPPYISKVTVSFFGFSNLFCSGKLKKKKKN